MAKGNSEVMGLRKQVKCGIELGQWGWDTGLGAIRIVSQNW